MAEAILYGTSRTDDEKFLWNAAFNNSEFISYITSIPSLIDYVGNDLYIPNNEYDGRIDFGTASFPSCSGYIGASAFNRCKNMTKVAFTNQNFDPSNMQYIGERAFNNCPKLSQVIFSAPRNISAYAFAMLYNLKSLTMWGAYNSDAEKIKVDIGEHAFELCTSIYVSIQHIRNIGDYAFNECNGMSSLSVGYYYCNRIGKGAFYNCSTLKSLTVNSYGTDSSTASNNKLIIDDDAFAGCTSLLALSVTNLKKIGKRAFKNLPNFSSLSAYVRYTESSKSTIVDYMVDIDEEAFYGCTAYEGSYNNISYVNIIHERAYYGCTKLKSMPGWYLCSRVCNNAFYGCTSLSSAILNQNGYDILSTAHISVECVLSSSAFAGIDNLSYVSINKIYSIPDYMFSGMSKLKQANFNIIQMYYLSSYIDYQNEKLNIGSHAFENCSMFSMIFVSAAGDIGDYAFANCTLLNRASIGSYFCNRVGKSAFKNCSLLTAVFLNGSYPSYSASNNQLYIDEYAFENCTGIQTLTIYGVSHIAAHAFDGCTNLRYLNLNNYESVTYLESIDVFNNAGSDYSVYVPASLYSDFIADSVWSLISDHITHM